MNNQVGKPRQNPPQLRLFRASASWVVADPGRNGFGWLSCRRPAAQPHDVESRAQSPVGIGEALGVGHGGARERGAAQRLAAARLKRVCAPHRAQVGKKREHVGVAHDRAVEIDDRQRQARPLRKTA